jgi:fructokinase
LVLSPERIVIGGGVTSHAELLPRVRREVAGLLNGYLNTVEVGENIDSYITPPALGSKSGVLGAIALAERT